MEQLDIVQLVGALVLGIPALAFAIKKFLSTWRSTTVEVSVLNLMHDELERMSEQNTKLSEELGKLHVEIINLNKQLRVLTEENQRLHIEVVGLRSEVARLQKVFK